MTVGLFVEGGFDIPMRGGATPLEKLWAQTLLPALGCQSGVEVFPISKKTIVALDPGLPKMSGSAEAFDDLFMRSLTKRPFDRAVVLWDLVPKWNPNAQLCRLQEVQDFFSFLSQSNVLGQPWKAHCAAKFAQLTQGPANPAPVAVGVGEIAVVVMEPMFESILIGDEATVAKALGHVSGVPKPKGWPNGWVANPKPDSLVIAPAIAAARKARPTHPVFRAVRGDYRTAKNGWG